MYSIYELSDQLYSTAEMQRKKWMIFGEGLVFLLILGLSFVITLRTIKKELKLSSQQKNFLMAVTHELKTPIASIKLYLQTLLKRDLDKEKQNDILTKSLEDTDRLNNLVESILLATQIDDQSLHLYKEEFNLSELVKNTAMKLMESNLKKLDFEFLVHDNILFNGDTDSFTSIVNNLISNAIKYSPDNSTITVLLEQTDSVVRLNVLDEGKGIPDSEKENVFTKFYRIGNENTRSKKGTGLGLFIVRYLVEKHNGRIVVQNNSPKGAIFATTFKKENS